MRKIKLCLLTLLAVLATSVLLAPSASAATRHYFGNAYNDINFGSHVTLLYTDGWVGNCDSSGYIMHLQQPVIGGGISSLKDTYSGDRCNYVVLYNGSNVACGNGAFYMPNVGAACNDKIFSIRFKYDSRLPA